MQDPQKDKTFPSTSSTEVSLVIESILVHLLHPPQPDIIIRGVGYLLASQKHNHHKVNKPTLLIRNFFSQDEALKTATLKNTNVSQACGFLAVPPQGCS